MTNSSVMMGEDLSVKIHVMKKSTKEKEWG